MLIRSIHVYHLLQDHQDLKKDHVLKKSAKLLCVPTVAFPQNLNGMQTKHSQQLNLPVLWWLTRSEMLTTACADRALFSKP